MSFDYETFGLRIGGEWRRRGRGESIEVIDPATEECIGRIPVASDRDIDDALDAAHAALHAWTATSTWERAAILRRGATLLRQEVDALAGGLSAEQGKPLAEAVREVGMAADHFEWASEECKRNDGLVLEGRTLGLTAQVVHEPVGCVVALTPWNFPALQPASKIAYALAAGCTVVIKPSEETPGICMALVEILARAGLPDGALNLIVGIPQQISARLIARPEVGAVSFTGSTSVGRQIMAMSADGLKRVTLELGGHAPVVVLPDADVERAATLSAQIKFRNAGQACVSPSRFYVHESVIDRFTKTFVACAQALRLGCGREPGVTMGPMASARQRQHAQGLVADALEKGAKVATGGTRTQASRGYFFEPTVLTDVGEDCAIMNVEPFCPVAPIVSYSDLDDAVARANRLPYGLAAYAFTSSLANAQSVARRLVAGMVGINNFALASAETPFGGIRQSGMGREGGPGAMHEFLQAKLIKTSA